MPKLPLTVKEARIKSDLVLLQNKPGKRRNRLLEKLRAVQAEMREVKS